MGKEERAGEEAQLAEGKEGGGIKKGWIREAWFVAGAGLTGSEPMGRDCGDGRGLEGGEGAGLDPRGRGTPWGFGGKNWDFGDLRGGLGLLEAYEWGEP